MRALLVASIALLSPPRALSNDVRVTTTAELRDAPASAKPGTIIAVAPGEYAGFHVSNVRGEEGRPIVVAGVPGCPAPVIRGAVQLSDVAWLEVERLVIERAPTNGINVDDAGTFETPSHHVVLRDLVVRDTGDRDNQDGIKLSGLDDFRVERCTVERWGRLGSALDMVGCHRGVIEGCTFRDRADDPASSGVQAKGGTRDVVIRRCRFEDAGDRAVNVGGSTALKFFRPPLVDGEEHFEAKAITVEGCTFLGSEAPVAFVGVDGAVVRWNTFYRPRKWIFRVLQETRAEGFVPCRRGVFADNLIAYRAEELAMPSVNVGSETAPKTFRFERNYWHRIGSKTSEPAFTIDFDAELVEQNREGMGDPLFLDEAHGDLRLDPKSPARAFGADALPKPGALPERR